MSATIDPSSFQARVQEWILTCFDLQISTDRLERNDRFIEEALELVQASGYPKDRAYALVDYVYGRPQGDINQEVGGVMVTLAAHCWAHGVEMYHAGEIELSRINQPEVTQKIRAKQAAKPTGSALPVSTDHIPKEPSTSAEMRDMLRKNHDQVKLGPVAWQSPDTYENGKHWLANPPEPTDRSQGVWTPLYPQSAIDQLTRERDEAHERGKDEAADYMLGALAKSLGLEQVSLGCDGSETWEGDASAMLREVLRQGDVENNETSDIATWSVIDSLAAENKRLREVMGPFAKEAEDWVDCLLGDDYHLLEACDASCGQCGAQSGEFIDLHELKISLMDFKNLLAELAKDKSDD